MEQQHIDEATLRPAPKIFKEDCRIDWEKPGREIVNFVRGLSPYPAAWTEMYREGDGAASSAKIFLGVVRGRGPRRGVRHAPERRKNLYPRGVRRRMDRARRTANSGQKRLAVRELLLGWRDVQQCRFRE